MWWKAEVADLHRVEDRLSTVYIERCHLDRDENAVVVVNKERTVRIPAAMLATVLLGPGTRTTHAAIALLADSGTSVCWVGENGVRMYASGLGAARGAQVIHRQAFLVTRPSERLQVARAMYQMRFPDDDVSRLTLQQLRGKEGGRVKQLYREHSERTGVRWDKRKYRVGEAQIGDDVNRLLSAANTALYGIAHAAIVGVGASPALGFVHRGSAISFVLDIADLYKAEYTIPLAFDLAASGRADESDARFALRDRVARGNLMPRIVRDVLQLLMGTVDVSMDDARELWDDGDGVVEGGYNWGSSDEVEYVEISGPELPDASGGGGVTQ